jgi:hypothetical protein
MKNGWQQPSIAASMRRASDDVYMPHPAPDSAIPDEDTKMGGFLSVLKVRFYAASSVRDQLLTSFRPWLSPPLYRSSSIS